MAFVDVILRHALVADPDTLVRSLSRASLRIGVPAHACITESIQRIPPGNTG
jgi:hypothetical protein